jgi:hypothetical protein
VDGSIVSTNGTTDPTAEIVERERTRFRDQMNSMRLVRLHFICGIHTQDYDQAVAELQESSDRQLEEFDIEIRGLVKANQEARGARDEAIRRANHACAVLELKQTQLETMALQHDTLKQQSAWLNERVKDLKACKDVVALDDLNKTVQAHARKMKLSGDWPEVDAEVLDFMTKLAVHNRKLKSYFV